MSRLFSSEIHTASVSIGGRGSGDINIDYVPQAWDEHAVQGYLDIWKEKMRAVTEAANRRVAALMVSSRPVLTDIKTASDCIPGMGVRKILVPGPPCEYSALGAAVRRSAAAAAVYEGWARDAAEAERMLAAGEIAVDSADCHSASAARASIISPSMPVFCVSDRAAGIFCYAPAIRGSSDAQEMISDETQAVPQLREALLAAGHMDIFRIANEGLSSGDDCCVRTAYSESLFRDSIIKECMKQDVRMTERLFEYLYDGTVFLQLFTAAVRAMTAICRNEEDCSYITSYCCNGRAVGIRISGKSDEWITCELGKDIVCGDELICELAGAGTAALCGSPKLLGMIGTGLSEAMEMMYDSYRASDNYLENLNLPYSGEPGSPLFLDYIKMIRTSCTLRFVCPDGGSASVTDLGSSLLSAALKLFVSGR